MFFSIFNTLFTIFRLSDFFTAEFVNVWQLYRKTAGHGLLSMKRKTYFPHLPVNVAEDGFDLYDGLSGYFLDDIVDFEGKKARMESFSDRSSTIITGPIAGDEYQPIHKNISDD